MDETPSSFSEGNLSAEDLAVLREFDAMEFIGGEQRDESVQVASVHGDSHADIAEELSPEDMLLLFIGEIEEDVNALRSGTRLLTTEGPLDTARLYNLERRAHKIKGSAGTFGCPVLSTIGRYTEKLLHRISQGVVNPAIGVPLVSQAVAALEMTLEQVVDTGEESLVLLEELEAAFALHSVDIASDTYASSPPPSLPQTLASNAKAAQELVASPISVRVELARFEQLLLHTGALADLQAPLWHAQEQVEIALQELYAAQSRLTRLESRYSTFPLSAPVADNAANKQGDRVVRPASSMIANILDEAEHRLGHRYVRQGSRKDHEDGEGKEQSNRSRVQHVSAEEPLYWDELEIDRYTETDALKNVLSEAIADVAAASAQLRAAFAQLNDVLQKQVSSASDVRSDTLSLRLTPLSALLGRIERVMTMNDDVQQGSISFEVRGETTEIDQEMLEELKNPLLRLARACVTPGLLAASSGSGEIHVWFHATDLGNELAIELGSSMHIESGAVDEVQDALHRLHGSIMVVRNSAGGMSFHLRLPRSQGFLKGLLVRAGLQQVIVPFAQIQRIDYGAVEDNVSSYKLSNLLGLPSEPHSSQDTFQDTQTMPLTGLASHRQSATHSSWQNRQQLRPMLVLYPERSALRVQVDAVLGDVEHVVKPLAPYLKRPGIAGTVIDDSGDVLLVVNPAELIHEAARRPDGLPEEQTSTISTLSKSRQKVVLVADDSVSIRGSLLQTLATAGYRAVGVNDGMEALEFLLDHAPDILLLDIEMPYLNGYDLLSIMCAHEHLASVKTIMLTSRSSEKHRRRALELGADAYLTKPCPHDVLLETITSLL